MALQNVKNGKPPEAGYLMVDITKETVEMQMELIHETSWIDVAPRPIYDNSESVMAMTPNTTYDNPTNINNNNAILPPGFDKTFPSVVAGGLTYDVRQYKPGVLTESSKTLQGLPGAASGDQTYDTIKPRASGARGDRTRSTMSNTNMISRISLESLTVEARTIAGQMIGQWFLCMHRRKVFFRLKKVVFDAQNALALDILKSLSPLEAQILDDPTFKLFPPAIFYKIFLKRENICVQYFTGKKFIKAGSEAAQDACRIMGKKQFLEQVLNDIEDAKKGCYDELDVFTLKDYMKVSVSYCIHGSD